jgi:hypothetical protein
MCIIKTQWDIVANKGGLIFSLIYKRNRMHQPKITTYLAYWCPTTLFLHSYSSLNDHEIQMKVWELSLKFSLTTCGYESYYRRIGYRVACSKQGLERRAVIKWPTARRDFKEERVQSGPQQGGTSRRSGYRVAHSTGSFMEERL